MKVQITRQQRLGKHFSSNNVNKALQMMLEHKANKKINCGSHIDFAASKQMKSRANLVCCQVLAWKSGVLLYDGCGLYNATNKEIQLLSNSKCYGRKTKVNHKVETS